MATASRSPSKIVDNNKDFKSSNNAAEESLEDLQLQTLQRIVGICPRPSKTVIDMIARQMNLSKEVVIDYFVSVQK